VAWCIADLDAVRGLIELTRDTEPADLGLGDIRIGAADDPGYAMPAKRPVRANRRYGCRSSREALIGLAARQNQRVLEPLARELSGEFYGSWSLEAAGLIKSRSLCPLLISLEERLKEEDLSAFGTEADRAIAVLFAT